MSSGCLFFFFFFFLKFFICSYSHIFNIFLFFIQKRYSIYYRDLYRAPHALTMAFLSENIVLLFLSFFFFFKNKKYFKWNLNLWCVYVFIFFVFLWKKFHSSRKKNRKNFPILIGGNGRDIDLFLLTIITIWVDSVSYLYI